MSNTKNQPETSGDWASAFLAHVNQTADRAMALTDFIMEQGRQCMESGRAFQDLKTKPDPAAWMRDAAEYLVDASQRAVLFMDVLRNRGNDFLDTIKKGQPPVLTFDYEIILSGKTLERPVNHDLALIRPRAGDTIDPNKRPIVVVDPRAGHGPGIGGSKQDSEIGMALEHGHPVYFILFYPDPLPGQTYEDVKNAQTRFVAEVKSRHPGSEEPALIGNCQAGWAVALLSADRPDLTGPIVLNGSPLSYWAGVDGKNPMRYRGGLLGGAWVTSLLCDLGNGKFDGANLVMNFECLNPANTLWTKQYNVWSRVDTEGRRYLDFEKWWNAYFMMSADEIQFIVRNLFVGNRLEQGRVEIGKDHQIDLKKLEDPVLVFASKGDNITPPQQALNWIAKVYGSVEEIRRCQQVIVYRVHEDIGHLGIFVSAKVARKEHKEIIANIDHLNYLPPGLYELVIAEGEKIIRENGREIRMTDYVARFEEREISDILCMDDGFADEMDFVTVAAVSEVNDRLYQTWISPWIGLFTNDATANILKWLHPMRVSRYAFSDLNPMMAPIKALTPIAREHRKPVSDNNSFLQTERRLSDTLVSMLNAYRDIRDATDEFLFKTVFENPWLKAMFPAGDLAPACPAPEAKAMPEDEREMWLERMNKGGITAGIVRVMVLMAGADRAFDEREFETARTIIQTNKRFADLSLAEFKNMAQQQARIIQIDPDRAFNALRWLLPQQSHRREAYEIAQKIAMADFVLVEAENLLLQKLAGILQIESDSGPAEAPATEAV